jgi:hypothetical protein
LFNAHTIETAIDEYEVERQENGGQPPRQTALFLRHADGHFHGQQAEQGGEFDVMLCLMNSTARYASVETACIEAPENQKIVAPPMSAALYCT